MYNGHCQPPPNMDSGRFLRNTLHLPVKSHIIPVPLRTSSITCSFLSFYTEITQDLDLEERSVNGKDGDTIVPTISLSPRVGMASEHFLLATRLVFQRLLEGLWIQSREGKAERALPSPSLSLPLCLRSPGACTPVSPLCHHEEQRGQCNRRAVAQPGGHPDLRVVVREQHRGESAFCAGSVWLLL